MRTAPRIGLLIGLILLGIGGLCAGGVVGAIWLTERVVTEAPSTPLADNPFPGLLITGVTPNGPGARAGLQPGHILLTANNTPINEPSTLADLLAQSNAGDAIVFTLLADGEQRQTTAVRANAPPYLGVDVIAYEGVPYATATPEPTAVPDADLPTISRVLPDTPAADVDLRPGDVITAVDGSSVLNTESLATAVAAKAPGDSITLTLRRGSDTLTRTLILAANPDNPQQGYMGIELAPLP